MWLLPTSARAVGKLPLSTQVPGASVQAHIKPSEGALAGLTEDMTLLKHCRA